MEDKLYGKRDKAGHWRPFKAIEYPQVFMWPAKPLSILNWIPSYLFPWNAIYAAMAVLICIYLTPSMEAMRSFSWGWISFIFARNVALVLAFFGAFHLRLYVQRGKRSVLAALRGLHGQD